MSNSDSEGIRDGAAPDIRTVIDDSSPFPPVRRIGALRPLAWLRLGWQDCRAAPAMSLFYGLCFAAMGLLLRLLLANAPQYLSGMSIGFLLLGPVLALGLYDISRRLEQGEGAMGRSVLAIRGRWSNIGILALVLGVIMLVWARASLVIFALVYTKGMPTMDNFLSYLFAWDNLDFLVAYACVAYLFASLVFALSWVSIPLMLDRDTDAISSMIISSVSLFMNIPATMVWAALIVALVVLGFGTWYLGLIVAMPVIGHASWHAYREVVGPTERPSPAR